MSDDLVDIIESTVEGTHVTRLVASDDHETLYRWGWQCRCGAKSLRVRLLDTAMREAEKHRTESKSTRG